VVVVVVVVVIVDVDVEVVGKTIWRRRPRRGATTGSDDVGDGWDQLRE
jgi:hypothetical protein